MARNRKTSVFEGIRAGLEDAIAYGRGDASRATVHVPTADEVDVRAVRIRLGLSQARFADRFGFAVSAVRDWEHGRRTPERSARILLRVIEREPDAVIRALAG
ncbi:MAG: helix-turn-helix domain-containing protein [Alphaproteobacteria bacterium]